MDFQTVVIGGGIAGITAALELAETGRKVALLESTIGSKLRELGYDVAD